VVGLCFLNLSLRCDIYDAVGEHLGIAYQFRELRAILRLSGYVCIDLRNGSIDLILELPLVVVAHLLMVVLVSSRQRLRVTFDDKTGYTPSDNVKEHILHTSIPCRCADPASPITLTESRARHTM
jgi:hypothetical protein